MSFEFDQKCAHGYHILENFQISDYHIPYSNYCYFNCQQTYKTTSSDAS